MNSEFKREHGRYFVIKDTDLTQGQRSALNHTLHNQGIPTRECVVIESDWPIYEAAWDMAQRLAEGREQRIAELERERDAYRTAEEHQIVLRQKIEQERDALAAHVETMRASLLEAASNPQLTVMEHLLAKKLSKIAHEVPTTSLARRDALKQAAALESMAKTPFAIEPSEILAVAAEFRRQAESQQ